MVPKLDPDAISSIGCNIASGIMVEAIMQRRLTKRTYYINASTLYRNFVSCLEGLSDDKIKMFKSNIALGQIMKMFIQDTTIFIDALVGSGIKLVIYIPDYSKASKGDERFRDLSVAKGLKYFINLTTEQGIDKLAHNFPGLILRTSHIIPHERNMLITTHHGYDMLNYAYKNDVTLIESHTGEFKSYELWYTKYFKLGKKNMSVFPFNEFLYMLLGDNTLIKPENTKFRQWLYDLAISKTWHFNMTQREVMRSITLRDKVMGHKLERQFKSKFK